MENLKKSKLLYVNHKYHEEVCKKSLERLDEIKLLKSKLSESQAEVARLKEADRKQCQQISDLIDSGCEQAKKIDLLKNVVAKIYKLLSNAEIPEAFELCEKFMREGE